MVVSKITNEEIQKKKESRELDTFQDNHTGIV